MCKITRNSATCRHCHAKVESKTRWDFVSCPCGAIFVDGGREYLRRGWPDGDPENSFTDTSEFDRCHDPKCSYAVDVVTHDCE